MLVLRHKPRLFLARKLGISTLYKLYLMSLDEHYLRNKRGFTSYNSIKLQGGIGGVLIRQTRIIERGGTCESRENNKVNLVNDASSRFSQLQIHKRADANSSM